MIQKCSSSNDPLTVWLRNNKQRFPHHTSLHIAKRNALTLAKYYNITVQEFFARYIVICDTNAHKLLQRKS